MSVCKIKRLSSIELLANWVCVRCTYVHDMLWISFYGFMLIKFAAAQTWTSSVGRSSVHYMHPNTMGYSFSFIWGKLSIYFTFATHTHSTLTIATAPKWVSDTGLADNTAYHPPRHNEEEKKIPRPQNNINSKLLSHQIISFVFFYSFLLPRCNSKSHSKSSFSCSPESVSHEPNLSLTADNFSTARIESKAAKMCKLSTNWMHLKTHKVL